MFADACESVIQYHDRTKHHPRRFARGPGHLDWANQPSPYRRFAAARLFKLPLYAEDDTPPYDAIYSADRPRPAPLTVKTLSRFLEVSLAISAWKQAGGSRWALRSNPSSGNLHPTEAYLILPTLDELHTEPGVYHYAPHEHGLEQRTVFRRTTWSDLMAAFGHDAFLVGLSSIHWREAWKYGERAFRYCQHDVGHALAALRIATAALGWRTTLLDALGDDAIARVLGLDRDADFPAAEREHPDLIAVVQPADDRPAPPSDLPPEPIDQIADGLWHGDANRLSAGHATWDIINTVAKAAHKPPTRPENLLFPAQETDFGTGTLTGPRNVIEAPRCELTVREITLQRRSGTAYDAKTAISAESFFDMLGRLVPYSGHSGIPWNTVPCPPNIHLFLFVHRVDGLAPGLYALVRDPARLTTIQAATKRTFEWTRPSSCPEALPLHRLVEGDFRRQAAHLSLGQDIAGDGAFSVAMVAEFEQPLREVGPWFYRRLLWEAGMIGQVLYLEAEAAGVRGTGIGAYFDDLVHDTVGLTGHTFQSLYHFAVGNPVEDPRISTLPPYPAERYSHDARDAPPKSRLP